MSTLTFLPIAMAGLGLMLRWHQFRPTSSETQARESKAGRAKQSVRTGAKRPTKIRLSLPTHAGATT